MSKQKEFQHREPTLKEISKEHLNEITKVHLSSFSDSALTKLGGDVVRQYYLWQLDKSHEKVRAVMAMVGNDCAGFSFSGVFKDSTSGFVDKNKTLLAKKVISRPWLVFNPLFRDRLLFGMRLLKNFNGRKKSSRDVQRKDNQTKSFGILAIAVSPAHQKLGIGKILMLDAENEAVKAGFERMHLTVSPTNEKAIRFYENLGWTKSLKDGVWKGSMIKMLK